MNYLLMMICFMKLKNKRILILNNKMIIKINKFSNKINQIYYFLTKILLSFLQSNYLKNKFHNKILLINNSYNNKFNNSNSILK